METKDLGDNRNHICNKTTKQVDNYVKFSCGYTIYLIEYYSTYSMYNMVYSD